MTITPEREREEWEPVMWRTRGPRGGWMASDNPPAMWRIKEPLYGPDLLSSYKAQGEELERALGALKMIAASVPAEKPEGPDYACGNAGDVASDAVQLAEWHMAEIARAALKGDV